MLFDARTRRKLREAGLDRETLRGIERDVSEAARAEVDRVEGFFRDLGATGGPDGAAGDAPAAVVYSDMELTHSSAAYPEHAVRYVDLFTHSQDVRGWIRFDTWGAYVEGARVVETEGNGGEDDEDNEGGDGDGSVPRVVELSLGPTVHDRVRFAAARDHLE